MNSPATPDDSRICWNERKTTPPRTLWSETAATALRLALSKDEESSLRAKYVEWLKARLSRDGTTHATFVQAVRNGLSRAGHDVRKGSESVKKLSTATINRMVGKRGVECKDFPRLLLWIQALGDSVKEVVDHKALALGQAKFLFAALCSARLGRAYTVADLRLSDPQVKTLVALSTRREVSGLSDQILSEPRQWADWLARAADDATLGKVITQFRCRRTPESFCETNEDFLIWAADYASCGAAPKNPSATKEREEIRTTPPTLNPEGKPSSQPEPTQLPGVLTDFVGRKQQVTASNRLISSDSIFISRLRRPLTPYLFGRKRYLEKLDAAWDDLQVGVLSLVGWAGSGKTALLHHWLRTMRKDGDRGDKIIYACTFADPGSLEAGPVTSGEFFQHALEWFGDPDPTRGRAEEKGERLAALVRSQRTLLILDGVESMQHPPGPNEGQLQDRALDTLLRELASTNPGLCVVTSRPPYRVLEDLEGCGAERLDVDPLQPEEGARILQELGVKGSSADREQVANEWQGHSLSLTLVGTYVRDVWDGDLSRRTELETVLDEEQHGKTAAGILASYERWLGDGPELAVLRVLALFSQAADTRAIEELRKPPAISGLTDHLQLSQSDWRRVLSKLRRAKLLAQEQPDRSDLFDSHPFVREYFGRQLQQQRPEAWRDGHSRLFDYFRNAAALLPTTREEMAKVYAAVSHGCRAGRFQEVLTEVVSPRLIRGEQFYSTNVFGWSATELALLSLAFKVRWTEPIPELPPAAQTLVLTWAGAYHFVDAYEDVAEQAMREAFRRCVHYGDTHGAANAASYLCDIHLAMGRILPAIEFGLQGLKIADESCDQERRVINRTTLAYALHFAGRGAEAEPLFREAEAIQQQFNPQSICLPMYAAFEFCAYLLDRGKTSEAIIRGEKMLQQAQLDNYPFHLGLARLTLGRANLQQAECESGEAWTLAESLLEQAIEDLRRSRSRIDILPALLTRAELWRRKPDGVRAKTDIDEVFLIATSCDLPLIQADCHLAFSRHYCVFGERELAKLHLATAGKMIRVFGYGRRTEELSTLESALSETPVN